ncbi:MAG: molybdopterin-dependent oxidoreductase [Desulfobacterales bacterium]|nr:molybdopterin-dependent oxidoreductase [Desulfobacterales bacterium]
MMDKMIRSLCGFCHSNCGIIVRVRDGKITRIEGDPENPVNRGYLCPKAQALKPMIESEERLKFPLKKMKSGFVKVSWDEALNLAADKLTHVRQAYGPESLVLCGGAPVTYVARDGFRQFMGVFGSPNFTGASNLCHVPRKVAFDDAFGGMPEPDLENSRLIIFWAGNPVNTTRFTGHASVDGFNRTISRAKERGANVVVIDPVRTETAALADEWVRPNIATDTALGLAMARTIIKENLYDRAFVEKWVIRFDEIKKHVEPLTPEWAEKITAVPADRIRELARLYATTEGAAIKDGNGLDMHSTGVDMVRTIVLLIALTGNIDNKGGNPFLPFVPQTPLPNVRSEKRSMGREQFPLFPAVPFPVVKERLMGEAPERPRAIIVHHSNPVLVQANRERTKQALEKLEFMMVMDIFPTATTELADLVLPAAADLEMVDYRAFSSTKGGFLALREKVVEPPGSARPVFEVEYGLAKKMGIEQNYPFRNAEEWLNFVLKPAKVSLDDLRREHVIYGSPAVVYKKYEREGFKTPSGKVECYSERFEKAGRQALPVFEYPKESPTARPDLAKKYTLCATTRRPAEFVHTKLVNLPTAGRIYPDPIVKLNASDASKRDVKQDDMVEVESRTGKIRLKANISEEVTPGLVTIDFGWGNPTDKKASINSLSPDDVWDPVSGGYPNRLFLCEVKKG